MSRWRIVVVTVLMLAPVGTLAALGGYYLWRSGLGFRVWWPMAASLVLGYVLAWHWQRRRMLLKPLSFSPPLQWTDRDLEAWKLIEVRAHAADKLSPDRLVELQFYISTAQEMALEVARFYHPGARDPLGSLTLPEILTVIELAARDLGELVDRYVPGGHLLTVNNWRQAKQATDWYSAVSNAYWAVSAIFSPIKTGLRYVATHLGMTTPWRLLQDNLVLWFYTAYVHEVGTYLIDLHSGRLRVGAARYRELVAGVHGVPGGESTAGTQTNNAEDDEVRQVTITVVGQVKAGKSSLINSILGAQLAETDVLPMTECITRYELQPKNVAARLVFLDTVGYGHSGPGEDQVRATEDAARQSDLLLLVLHARNPGRAPDVALLDQLRTWFAARPDLKMPPVLGVLTHIDLLSPAMEWTPPYDWQQPQRPKEQQIREAWSAVREQLDRRVAGIAPACTAANRAYGIDEYVLPALIELLPEARAVAMLRCLRAEADADKVRKVLRQLLDAGRAAASILLNSQPR